MLDSGNIEIIDLEKHGLNHVQKIRNRTKMIPCRPKCLPISVSVFLHSSRWPTFDYERINGGTKTKERPESISKLVVDVVNHLNIGA